jgi:hypothetical protein
MCDGSAELSNFGPLDKKDDAVPTVRKAVRGKCDGRPVGTPYNGPMSLTRPDVMRGPRFTSTDPRAGAPALHLIGFPLGAGHSVGRVQSRRAMGSGGTSQLSQCVGNAMAAQAVHRTTAR